MALLDCGFNFGMILNHGRRKEEKMLKNSFSKLLEKAQKENKE